MEEGGLKRGGERKIEGREEGRALFREGGEMRRR